MAGERFKIYSAERLVHAVGADATKRFEMEQVVGKKTVDVVLQPRFLKSLKARVVFSLWDDMIAQGEGSVADSIIKGDHGI